MIVSASRRTDIPAFYAEWFIHRLEEGYALVSNPRNPGRISKVPLSPKIVDCIVFWTKNPAPMLCCLEQIAALGYAFYFQFTLTPYGPAVETGLPPKENIEETFLELSRRIGKERVHWRYDPVFVDNHHTVAWHTEQFDRLCKKLQHATGRCTLSFLDAYKSLGNAFQPMSSPEMHAIAKAFSAIAAEYGIPLYTCAEEIDLQGYGIAHGACIDQRLVKKAAGYRISAQQAKSLRGACCCVESVDIGAYDTCANGCRYCYATAGSKGRMALRCHAPHGPMLTGYPLGNETITERVAASQRRAQISFLEEVDL